MSNNPKFNRLFDLLDQAEKLAAMYTGGYSDHFFSAEEFHEALAISISRLKAGDNEQLSILRIWFAPSYDWDDFICDSGEELANEIYPLVVELGKSLDVE